jgi:hypothetical protein
MLLSEHINSNKKEALPSQAITSENYNHAEPTLNCVLQAVNTYMNPPLLLPFSVIILFVVLYLGLRQR